MKILESNSRIEIFDSCCHSFAVGSLVAEWWLNEQEAKKKCPGG